MKSNGSFSQRNGFDTIEAIPITIRNDAHHELRGVFRLVITWV